MVIGTAGVDDMTGMADVIAAEVMREMEAMIVVKVMKNDIRKKVVHHNNAG
jgi:hypothetical protein